jgi:radical SAM protein with 4Fe4S-binding SPASM domain
MGVLGEVIESYKRAHRPAEVMLEVTHRCNLPCTHCYLPDHEDHGELSFDEICGIFDQLREAGTLFLTLTGGEVLSRSDFLEIVDAAAARGFAVKVLTNATMITDEVADRFAAAGVLEVSISVYGAAPEVHDRVTEMPGSWERTMAGIRRLRARGLHVVTKSPVMTLNGKPARDLKQWAAMNNLPCNLELSITAKTNGDPSPLEYQLQRPQLIELMLDPVLQPSLLPDTRATPEPCNAGKSYCSIGPTGDLMPCIMMPVVVGNLREKSFAELWDGDPLFAQLHAIEKKDLHVCAGCDVAHECSRCPGLALQRGQGIDGCDLSGKQIARARVEARMRLRVV